MKLYHATKRINEASIDKDGLKATSGLYDQEGMPLNPPECSFVYFTPDLEHAKTFGSLIYAVDSKKLDQSKLDSYRELICDMMHTDDYWNFRGDVPASLLTKLSLHK